MEISSYYLAILIGLTLSLIVETVLGITPGVLVVPAYVALVLDRPAIVCNIFLVSILTYLFIRFVLSRFILIYGKRRFVACVMIALLLKFLLNLLYPAVPFSVLSFSGIGVVASGVLANCYFRQGVFVTSAAALICSGITFALVNLCCFI